MTGRDLDDLLLRARRHDADALDELVVAYSPRVFGLLFRLTGSRDIAEDLLQETFLRLVRTIAEYQHDGRFEAWLFRIAANLARDHARRSKVRGPAISLNGDGDDDAGGDWGTDLPDRTAAPDQALLDNELGDRLAAALDRLSDPEREILLLRHYGELPFSEIARLLAVPLGTALARAHRALQRLKGLMIDADARV